MELIIGKDIKIINPTYQVLSYCENNLVITNPQYVIANQLGRYVGKMEKSLKLYVRSGNMVVLPFGCLADVWKLSRDAKYRTLYSPLKGNKLNGAIQLYPYQQKALLSLVRGKNGILEAPCGSGKTQIGLALIKEIGGRALWLTHTKKLLQQSMERAKSNFDGDFGTITEGEVNMGKDITFATVQTMKMVEPSVYENEFDIVIVDECHHCVGTPTKVMQFYKVLTNCNARYKYGLSATLSRSDGMITCVYSIIGKKLHTITEKEVGEKIIKAKHIREDVDISYPLDSYCESDGMINYGKLISMLSNNEERNCQIIHKVEYLYLQGKKQLILCSRVSQVQTLARDISKFASVSCITGKVRSKERDYDKDVIVATFSLAKEGLDIPTLDVVHFATPQKDRAIVKQSAGRVERNYEGKPQPMVIDYVDKDIDYCEMCYRKRVNILKKIK